jgi:flagellar protein FliO/FliZ
MEALGSIWQVAFALILVIAVVLGLGYAAKKTRLVKTGGAGALKIVDSAYLGPKERLVLVQVGDRQVLIGMNAQVITALTQITNGGDFSAALQRVQSESSLQPAPAQETQS